METKKRYGVYAIILYARQLTTCTNKDTFQLQNDIPTFTEKNQSSKYYR